MPSLSIFPHSHLRLVLLMRVPVKVSVIHALVIFIRGTRVSVELFDEPLVIYVEFQALFVEVY